jgi:hypothetical protein
MPPPIPQRSAESHSKWQKTHKKVKGNGTKKTPLGILKNKDTPAATKKKSAQSIISPDLGVNNSATTRVKGKKKSRGRKVSFNGKKAAKPTKLHK